MSKRTICLIGNPNCGKTTLFNELTGTNQRVGNWPGVTVERKEGYFQSENWQITLVDLPGIYSLDTFDEQSGLDETVARDYLLSSAADLVINILDASNLERNLYLTTQIMEMRLPMVVVLNMTDMAQDRGLKINSTILSERLGCPVVTMVASRGQGLQNLTQVLDRELHNPAKPHPYVAYPPVVEDAIASLMPPILERETQSPADARWLALKLLEQNNQVAPSLGDPVLVKLATENRRKIRQIQQEDIDIVLADSRYGWIRQLVLGAAERTHEVDSTTSDKLDRIVLNRWFGIPIFLGMMYLLFLLTINVGGAFIDFFDIAAGTIFVDGLGELLSRMGLPQWLIVVFADGMGGGIQTVATFIPIIGILFLFLALLEDSGYMARAAFVMDRFMRFIGLPGKSFVPMLIGFGCNVPAIMATRTLESKRDRLLTIMMNPFMSCGARLPVYALFAAAFFPMAGQNIVFGLYLIGIAMAIFTGLMLKSTLLRGQVSHFVMELPPYHLPTVKGVLLRAWERLKSFMFRAGKVIVLMVMVLSILNSIGVDGSFGNEDSDRSILSGISRTVTPIFEPFGIHQDNWPATVGIFTGVFAKEAVVGTLDSIYGDLGEQTANGAEVADEPFDFWGGMGEAFASIPANLSEVPGMLLDPLGLSVGDVSELETAATEQEVGMGTFGAMVARFDGKVGAFAYLLFVLLYFPCVAAMGAVYRETNWGWTAFVGGWTTGLAYATATLFYQLGTFAQHPGQSIAWTAIIVLVLGLTYGGLKLARPSRQVHKQQIAH
ncbi:ferrous iron transport protein b [Leptolyngbya sp. Heron Island J]|uniref:Fe(2+) transporter permease subunit FeoB n=1 Tax=Leptolyngbya sp. Heron Island J TaxID=1385935 RepID=UPI0003B9AEB1|nr:Fe(2+) transporter permease subunit FeoB [Leptolyngbya sp. Heron Island J]ESA34889.1 ferrous iron transport protein b [Leptolyngbya sp. Heron Island J]